MSAPGRLKGEFRTDSPEGTPVSAPGGNRRAQPEGSPATLHRALVGAAVALVLAAVFAAYLNPHLMVDLANAVWACF